MSGILSIIIGNKSIREMKNDKGEALEEIAYQMADKMDAYMWSRSGEIFTLSHLDTLLDSNDVDTIQNLLEQLKVNIPSFSWIGLTDNKGTVIASTEGILSGVDISERPVFIEGKKGKFIGDVHDAVLLAKLLPNPSGEPMKFVDVSTQITDSKSSFKGVLAAHLSWDWAREIEKSVMEPLHDRSNIEMFVVSSKDNVILLGNNEMIGKTLNLNGISETKDNVKHWSVETWDDGKQYLTGYTLADGYMNYKGLGWITIVRQPLKQAYSSIRDLQLFILLVGSICAIIFSIIIWLIASKIANPIKQISTAAEYLRIGKKEQIPQYYGIKEIEMLSVSLRELVNSLMKSETALDVMESKAHNDFLTGIPNRVGLEKYLEYATQAALENHNKLLFLCLDLDGFKNVNDTYGHHIGDLLLKEVSKKLSKFVTNEELVARLGGDEFVIVVQGHSYITLEEKNDFANRIITEINTPIIIEGHSLHVGCSIGGAIWSEHLSVTDILKKADEALYDSKHNGKNKVTFYSTFQ
jgi:diguanylate cyclase (GGDEF)-like protein